MYPWLAVQALAHRRGTMDVGFPSISDFGSHVFLILKRFPKRLHNDLSLSGRCMLFCARSVFLWLSVDRSWQPCWMRSSAPEVLRFQHGNLRSVMEGHKVTLWCSDSVLVHLLKNTKLSCFLAGRRQRKVLQAKQVLRKVMCWDGICNPKCIFSHLKNNKSQRKQLSCSFRKKKKEKEMLLVLWLQLQRANHSNCICLVNLAGYTNC